MDTTQMTAMSALVVAASSGLAQLWQVVLKQRVKRAEGLERQRSREFQAYHAAIKHISIALQAFQDEVMLLSKSATGGALASAQQRRLKEKLNGLLHSYQENHTDLDSDERDLLNLAKDLCADVVLALTAEGVWDTKYSKLDDNQKRRLESAGAQLLMYQSQLLQSRIEKLPYSRHGVG